MADLETLAGHFRASGNDHAGRSTLYARLNREIADAPEIVSILTAAPELQQLPVLLLAAVHSLVLAEPESELAAWYPTTTPEPRTDDPFPPFRRFCLDRERDLRSIVSRRSVQTNEVGRGALLLPGIDRFVATDEPIALVDVGTSAGLNLALDHYEYRYEPGPHVGGPSDVVITCGVRGDVHLPPTTPEVTRRIGIDRNLLDPGDADDARWLLACVWPDQADRFERLRGALEIAAGQSIERVAGDVLDALAPTVGSVDPDLTVVVMNSWVLNYLAPSDRATYEQTLGELGAERDLVWVSAEAPALCAGLTYPDALRDTHQTVVSATAWRSGHRSTELIGVGHPHGYWLHALDHG